MTESEQITVRSLADDIAHDHFLLSLAICEAGDEDPEVLAFCRAAIAVCEAGEELTPAHGLVLAVAIQAIADARAERIWNTVSA